MTVEFLVGLWWRIENVGKKEKKTDESRHCRWWQPRVNSTSAYNKQQCNRYYCTVTVRIISLSKRTAQCVGPGWPTSPLAQWVPYGFSHRPPIIDNTTDNVIRDSRFVITVGRIREGCTKKRDLLHAVRPWIVNGSKIVCGKIFFFLVVKLPIRYLISRSIVIF